jgi:hypothetical protein
MRRLNRLGTFFIVLGGGSIALFAVSDFARLPDYPLLFWGMIAIVVGSLIKWISPKPVHKSANRFRILHSRNDDEDK